MPFATRRALLLPVAALLLAGCGGPRSGPETGPEEGAPPPAWTWPGPDGAPSATRAGCAALPGDAARDGVFTVAVTDSVRPGHAPVPGNDAERLVFAQLYETLVTTGCDGALRPGLAAEWRTERDGAVWTFTLRADAVLWDGTPVTADLVRASWGRADPDAARRTGLTPLTVVARDARTLEVRPARPSPAVPYLLANPAWAVAARRPGWTWPVGSGPARLRASSPPPLPDLVCRPNPQHPARPRWRELVFDVHPGADPRDLVSRAPDLLLVRTRAAAAFFAELPEHAVAPLPADRLHLLVCPPRAGTAARWRRAAAALRPGRDLTAVAAAPWDAATLPAGPLDGARTLRVDPTPAAARLDSPLGAARLDSLTVVHADDDPAATELAGRLAALAGSLARAHALSAADLDAALHWQLPGAAVVTLAPLAVDPGLQAADLAGRWDWLADLPTAREADLGTALRRAAPHLADLTASGRVVPLAVSSPWLVTRGPLAGLALDGAGVPQLAGLGRRVAGGDVP